MKLNIQTPGAYTMLTKDLQNGTDTMMFLYAPDSTTLLACNDDAGVACLTGAPGKAEKTNLSATSAASRIDYNFSKAGTYYLMIKDFSPTAWGTLMKYNVAVTGGALLDSGVYLPIIMSDF